MTIVAALDFSTVTDRVFEIAVGLADSFRARIVLLHVVQPSETVAASVASEDIEAAEEEDEEGVPLEEGEEEEEELIEDASELGEDEDDMAEVIDNVEEDEP